MPTSPASKPLWLQHLIEDLSHPDPVQAYIAQTALRLLDQRPAAGAPRAAPVEPV